MIAGRDVSKALEAKARPADSVQAFAFAKCDENRYQMWSWSGDEIRGLVGLFRTVESLPWAEVLRHKGLRMRTIDRSEFPANLQQVMNQCLSADITQISELRASGAARVFGYRVRNVFTLLWFDRQHEVFPE